jgi:phage terminase large subunit-like protein
MTILCVPSLEEEPWPTLGAQVCEFITQNLVHGPGDLRGEPARLDDEKRALIYRAYEVFPQGNPQAGRRRFRRVGWSLRKGSAKTELAAWIAACELHPEAPVRCTGWDKRGEPIGGPVRDPYIPLVAYTEEQSEELCYGTLLVVLGEGPLANDFDLGLERILRKKGDGKAVALATAPAARDGARTTFEVFDETHRFTLDRLKKAHRIMLANLPKRLLADPWALEVTTAPTPGEGSVAEATMDYARAVADGHLQDSKLFFFHREASANHDLSTVDGIRAAVVEASGPVAVWSDIEGIVEQWRDPTTDKAELERLWLNRLVQASEKAFDVEVWRSLAKSHIIPDGALVALGFDGSRFDDATAIVMTEVDTGHQSLIGLWEKPPMVDDNWEVPEAEVDAVMHEAFGRWNVWRLYADPRWWEATLARWAGEWGEKRVIAWYTNRLTQMAYSLRSFATAIQAGELSHDGNEDLSRHIGNACRRTLNLRDAEGAHLWVIQKERPDSPFKIDAGMAAVLSNEARIDAIAAGAKVEEEATVMFV